MAAQRLPGQLIAAVLVMVVALGACSSGSGSKHAKKNTRACALIAKLDTTAATVERADISDPAAFKKTLDRAVAEYLSTLRLLRRLLTGDAQRSVDRVTADVQQYRFDDARTHRAALDAYAQRECDRTIATTSTVAR